MQALSPTVQAFVGTYSAVLPTADGDVRCELTLASDASATFRTSPPAGGAAPASYTGAWIADGGTVQLMVRNPDDPAKPVAVTLEPGDGALTVKEIEGRASPYVGLTFARSSEGPAVSESTTEEKP